MPQLDIVTLFSQIFWLLPLYFIVFFYVTHYYLPKFSKLLKLRLTFTFMLSSKMLVNTTVFFKRYISRLKKILCFFFKQHVLFFSRRLKHFNTLFLMKTNTTCFLAYTQTLIHYFVYRNLYL